MGISALVCGIRVGPEAALKARRRQRDTRVEQGMERHAAVQGVAAIRS